MKILEKIYEIIDNEGIILEEVKFKHSYIEGLYFKAPGLPPSIAINKSILSDSKRLISVLAEELGHHFTSYGDLSTECFTYSEKIQISKQERKARNWATNFIMPYEKIIDAIKEGYRTIFELSDYFNVTPIFILDRFYFLSLEKPNLEVDNLLFPINQSIYYEKEICINER
ncbi:ImmA/IrrE family metallo-endopeptidase [Clostridium sp. 'White wine YQ']|uniref:ImmA/IrrE family metallo-endopeptidase n=1 Tax=Clostridium sp. 'White wine YQ' TaxID=3027474 RepID=UPI0023664B8E|nr:ImmA/IrrE family metallo-endopeptidase [Clostridium sp. 'White wine YQ']MDD7793657.1 ImmA/IrrE family metallo-endopeptidase [Clostridium sp. 'White wine YQ']